MCEHRTKVSHTVGQQIVITLLPTQCGLPCETHWEVHLKMALSSSVPGPEIGVVFMLYKFIIKKYFKQY